MSATPRLSGTSASAPPINIEHENRGGTIAYWQGDYYQSRADRNGVSLLDYIHAIYGLVRQKKARTVLIVGCAGGSLATMLARGGCRVLALDVNRLAFLVARTYFGLPESVECRIAEGASFLSATRRKFDVIVFDAFDGGRIDSELISERVFTLAATRLAADGALFVNVHVKSDADRMPDRVAAAMRRAFSHVRLLDRPVRRYRNAILMAGAVRDLKRPALEMKPVTEAKRLATQLAAMRFRRARSIG